MTATDHMEQLRAEAAHRRQRLDLYRAKVYGPRPTSVARLTELEREYELAASRLKRAEARRGPGALSQAPQQTRSSAALIKPSGGTPLVPSSDR